MAEPNDDQGRWKWIIEKAPAIAFVSGLILYGILRLSYALFYDRIGIKPEDIGLGYAEILAQSVAGLLLLLVLLLLLAIGTLSFFAIAYSGVVDQLLEVFRQVSQPANRPSSALDQPKKSPQWLILRKPTVLVGLRLCVTMIIMGATYLVIGGGLTTFLNVAIHPVQPALVIVGLGLLSAAGQLVEASSKEGVRKAIPNLWQRTRTLMVAVFIIVTLAILAWLPFYETDARRRTGRLQTDPACSRWGPLRSRRLQTDTEGSSG